MSYRAFSEYTVHCPHFFYCCSEITKFTTSNKVELLLLVSLKCRFTKVGNSATGAASMPRSQHVHHDDVACRSEMTSHVLDSANGSWRLSLLRSVMGDSICETGICS